MCIERDMGKEESESYWILPSILVQELRPPGEGKAGKQTFKSGFE